MIKVVAKIDFTMNGKQFIAGDEIDLKDIKKITKLNELGYIQPLSYQDLVKLERELKTIKEEI